MSNNVVWGNAVKNGNEFEKVSECGHFKVIMFHSGKDLGLVKYKLLFKDKEFEFDLMCNLHSYAEKLNSSFEKDKNK